MSQADKYLALGGFKLLRTTGNELEQQLQGHLEHGEQTALFFANTNFIVQCQGLQEQMAQSTLIINDGIGVDIGTWLVHRTRFPQNLNGTDFIPAFLHSIQQQGRVYLFGGKPGIALRAANTLRTEFGVNVVGVSDGYSQGQDTQALINQINNSGANVLLVAMGNPLQERWILQQRANLKVTLLFGVGALLDFLAGDKPRAPDWIRRLRLEWFYRLCLEPARLARRYTLDIGLFLALCLRTGKRTGNYTNSGSSKG
ncbi:WecB/TagA/CpsF family glycosyltransferase [Cellvibrio sp. UBA7671]|uniref:WecB/TagA/CpsF family glycosyltransferase n=1 Tax=Cellvibrio sp. UBA7671 TaxID=1946312 RepID=UPI002F352C6E